MEKQKTESLCAMVRAQYGDTVEQFAVRMGVPRGTIYAWEKQAKPFQTASHALLLAAQKGNFPATPPVFDDHIENMEPGELIRFLASGYGDSLLRFAQRIGVNYDSILNWNAGQYKFSNAAKRLFRHILENPGDFVETPAPIQRKMKKIA